MTARSQEVQQGALNAIALRVNALARSNMAIRIAELLEDTDSSREERCAILALGLTEMSARPSDARFIEWLCVIPLRRGLLGSAGREWAQRRTVGPFQIRNGPLRLSEAVAQVRLALSARGVDYTDAHQLAVVWHGPATGDTRSMRYSSVLRHAMIAAIREPALSRKNCQVPVPVRRF